MIKIFLLLTIVSAISYGHHRKPSKKDLASPHYQFIEKHHRQSIGKIFKGREIAEVMGAAGIPWLERPERQKEEDINGMITALQIRPGMKVVDLGTGSGILALKMATKVGPKGRVFALDIQQKMLNVLQRKLTKQKIKNVIPKRNSLVKLNLSSNSIDLLLMVDVYHELSHPYEILKEIYRSLKPGGRVALVEYRGEDPRVPIKKLHKMTLKQIRKELKSREFPFVYDSLYSKLPRQHLVFFRKPTE